MSPDPLCLDCRAYIKEQVAEMMEKVRLMFEGRDAAVVASRVELDRRLAEVNEIRRQAIDDRQDFVRRELYESHHTALQAEVRENNKETLKRLEGFDRTVGKVGAVAAMLGALAAILAHLIFGGKP